MDKEKTKDRYTEFMEDLIKARRDMKTPRFDCKVAYGATNFKYASLGAVLDVVVPSLLKHNLFLTQVTQVKDSGTVLVTSVRHVNGESIESSMALDVSGKCQDVGKRLTYRKRYLINSMFALYAEEDTDGTHESEKSKKDKGVLVKEFKALIGKNKEIEEKIFKAKGIKDLGELSSEDIEVYKKTLIRRNGG